MANARIIAWGLALAGLIPFVGCAGLVLFAPSSGDAWLTPLGAYGAIILSFLGGAHWGRELAEPQPRALPLVLSNLPAIAAWLTFLPTVPHAFQFLVLIFGFIAMLYWDWRDQPTWYRPLRLMATVGAALSLGVVMQSL